MARPIESAATEIRPPSRIVRNCLSPAPRLPSRFSSGTAASAKESSRVSDARQPIFRYVLERVKPGVSWGTIRLEISLRPRSSVPVTAVIVVPPVMSVPELVMNALVPLMIQRPSRSSARVCVAPASEPALGSVKPNAQSFSPRASGTRYCCFCASVPKR